MELKLSSAYEHLDGEPDLELKVILLNINEGHNKERMEHCQILKEYAIYVARVRKYAAEMKLDDAVNKAIEECIKEGGLADFLQSIQKSGYPLEKIAEMTGRSLEEVKRILKVTP